MLAPAVAEPEQLAGGGPAAGGQRLAEPRVRVGAVVGHDVDDDPDAQLVRLGDERLGLGQRAEGRVDVAVVGHVVAGVGHRGRVPRAEPDRVDAEVAQVAQACADPDQVADAVAVAVGEAARVDLVDRGAAPPRGGVARRGCGHLRSGGMRHRVPAFCCPSRGERLVDRRLHVPVVRSWWAGEPPGGCAPTAHPPRLVAAACSCFGSSAALAGGRTVTRRRASGCVQ